LVYKTTSGDIGSPAEATRILYDCNRVLEKEAADLQNSCGQRVSGCLADKASLLISERKMDGLICPEIEQRIIHGVSDRHPYELLIEGSVVRRFFSKGRKLNPENISTNQALKAWGVLYDIEFDYESGSDTYHFSRRRNEEF
jgi:hypothetical protein